MIPKFLTGVKPEEAEGAGFYLLNKASDCFLQSEFHSAFQLLSEAIKLLPFDSALDEKFQMFVDLFYSDFFEKLSFQDLINQKIENILSVSYFLCAFEKKLDVSQSLIEYYLDKKKKDKIDFFNLPNTLFKRDDAYFIERKIQYESEIFLGIYIKSKILYKNGSFYDSYLELEKIVHNIKYLSSEYCGKNIRLFFGIVKEECRNKDLISTDSGLADLYDSLIENRYSSSCFVLLSKYARRRNIPLRNRFDSKNKFVMFYEQHDFESNLHSSIEYFSTDVRGEIDLYGINHGDYFSELDMFAKILKDNEDKFYIEKEDTNSIITDNVFDEDIIINEWNSDEDNSDHGFGISDGYGGYIDDDLLNDGLDGEADAYWNID